MTEKIMNNIVRLIVLFIAGRIMSDYMPMKLCLIVAVLIIIYSILTKYDYHLRLKYNKKINVGKFLDQ